MCFICCFFLLLLLQVSSFSVSCPKSIGKLVLIELDKKRLPLFPDDAWFCSKVEVKSPEGDIYSVPIYRWISDSEVHRFSEATGLWKFACLTCCTLHWPQRTWKKDRLCKLDFKSCLYTVLTVVNLLFLFKALRVFEDNHHLGKYTRQQELKQREEDYRWEPCLHVL